MLPPLVLPGSADPAQVVLKRVEFQGNRAMGEAELQAIAAPFLNRALGRLDLEELRQQITRAYIARGYVNSGALLPDQSLDGGTLRVTLIEGTVSELRFTGLDRLSPSYLHHRLVAPGQTLALPVLQQRFGALLDDPLIERLNARLQPGATLGESVLEVDVTRSQPYQLTLFAHNQGAPAVGSAVGGAELRLLNLTTWGDQLTAVLGYTRSGDQHDVAWTIPLAARQATLQLRSARSRSSIVEEPLASLGIASQVDTQELTFALPLFDQLGRRFALGLTWGDRISRTTLDGEPFSFIAGEPEGRLRVRAWRFFQEATLRQERHVLALRSTFVFGRNNVQADTGIPGAPEPRYRLWLGQAQAAIALGEGGQQLVLRGSVQHTRDHLAPLEQLGLGGRHTVRGYRENQFVRDRGWALSAEGHLPLLGGDGARRRLWLVPFVDGGQVRSIDGATQGLASAGLGLRGQFDSLEAEIFVARRLERRPVDTRGDLQDDGIHLQLRWRAF
ncbi:ShlB/FhaC/HecB family hemolysin secretion/activation protein [Pseudorhodoferax sp.]|uniref:ShlB/FhaC/HecB family hemolysin secretion/activation protein n=1 Tax=Pseudorhodoferax sp. TaxID=1993553 RepID=UPI002DD6564E|nr:ShlB/FhaC/HecB family hemolysin secretion/activation protein [Pseudorhodoferax sp.]